jgi:cellulose synthase/poly-beta-1,6-N-acetylglucosamine synthase-like glycosyltransferase
MFVLPAVSGLNPAALLPAILLAVAALLIAYVMIGYPLLLSLIRRRSAPPVRKDLRFQTTVSVILAVHNGASFIRAKLASLRALDYPPDLLEILVVSDGSTDETEAIVEQCSAPGLRLVRSPRGGKAAALNAALEHASGQVLFFTDVRQPLDRLALRHLIANFHDPTVGAVSGELRLLRSSDGKPVDLDLYWRYELWARRRHSVIDSMFNTTGCIYAVRRELVDPLPPDTLIDDALIPLRAFFRGYRVVFDPEAIAFDDPSLFATGFDRRLRTLAGLWQLHVRLPRLFTGANRMRFHFLSHKFSRLLLPWAIVLAAAATFALPDSPFRTLLLIQELALVALAIADRAIPAAFPLKRLSSPARTFLLMNAAALLAIVVFFVPANRLWRPRPAAPDDVKEEARP